MRSRLKLLLTQVELFKSMVWKNLKAKYVGSVLGISWSLLVPIFFTAAIAFVFTVVIKVEIRAYPLFVMSGMLAWIFFNTALTEASESIIANVNLIHQFNFARELFPLSSVCANFLNFILGLSILIPVFVIFNEKVLFTIWLLPLVIFLHLLFTVGLALFLAWLNVCWRELRYLLGVLFTFWFWVTPVFYSLEMVPGPYQWIIYLNPMTIFITSYRKILYEAQIPSLVFILSEVFIALASLFLGYFSFIKKDKLFGKL